MLGIYRPSAVCRCSVLPNMPFVYFNKIFFNVHTALALNTKKKSWGLHWLIYIIYKWITIRRGIYYIMFPRTSTNFRKSTARDYVNNLISNNGKTQTIAKVLNTFHTVLKFVEHNIFFLAVYILISKTGWMTYMHSSGWLHIVCSKRLCEIR